ncbi:MAG: hypothetical protein GY937_05220 [bacterium]|nr:hypothetical protein [bacterium]
MQRLGTEAFARAREFLIQEGRALDLAVFLHVFEDGPVGNILDALTAFQNPDGGLGHALEPDFRMPASSPMATMVGLDLLRELDAPRDAELPRRAIRYLVDTWDPDLRGWSDVTPEVNDYPHAPWWHHEPERRYGPQGHWGNPGGQITAALWRHREDVSESLLREATRAGLDALDASDEPLTEYVALGYSALAEQADPETRKRILPRLLRDAPGAVATDPARWKVEAFQPIWLVRGSGEPMAAQLAEVLSANLDWVIAGQDGRGCWEPNWIWFGQPPEAFEPARKDWCSERTALFTRLLAGHGRL